MVTHFSLTLIDFNGGGNGAFCRKFSVLSLRFPESEYIFYRSVPDIGTMSQLWITLLLLPYVGNMQLVGKLVVKVKIGERSNRIVCMWLLCSLSPRVFSDKKEKLIQ